MDTTYYSFETKKIKVSGGADMLAVVPAAVPASPAGEVLDFALCRRRLETKAAWKDLAQAVEAVKTPSAEQGGGEAAAFAKRPRKARTSRVDRAGGWLELCASLAVILVCVWAGWGFLALV